MAFLRCLRTGTRHPLCARTLIGRSNTCTLRLESMNASGEHAMLVWAPNGTWQVRDLGSRNGTFVGGGRVEPGPAVRLSAGSPICFGDLDDAWELERNAPPGIVAIDLVSGDAVGGEEGLLALGPDSAPEVVIYEGADGWTAEQNDHVTLLDDRAVLNAGDKNWCIHLPGTLDETPLADDTWTLEATHFTFAVSRDEERVEMRLRYRDAQIVLPPREHSYILLTLARALEADGVRTDEERGWVGLSELKRRLKIDGNTLNVAVHRARHQLVTAGIRGGAAIVEVRRGRRRLGIRNFDIVRDAQV